MILLSLQACVNRDENKLVPLIGRWEWQESMIVEGVDYTKGWYEAHDAICYEFKKDSTYIKSGGPEPLEPERYRYELYGDSILRLYEKSEDYRITKITTDTIWLQSHTYDTDSIESLYFLKRIK